MESLLRLSKKERLIGPSVISNTRFNIALVLTLMIGVFINIFEVKYLEDFMMEANVVIVIITYFAAIIFAVFCMKSFKSPIVSMLGFVILAIDCGLPLCYIAYFYNYTAISLAFQVVLIDLLTMIILGTIFKKFFLNLGLLSLFSLIFSVTVETVLALNLGKELTTVNYIFITLFSLNNDYIISKAQKYSKSYKNAIVSAADLYLEIINVFLRIFNVPDDEKV